MAVRMSGSGTSSVRVGGIQGLRIGSEVTLEAHVGLVGSLEAALAANPVGRSLAQSAITCVVALEYRLARVPRGVSPEAGHARRCGAISTLTGSTLRRWALPALGALPSIALCNESGQVPDSAPRACALSCSRT